MILWGLNYTRLKTVVYKLYSNLYAGKVIVLTCMFNHNSISLWEWSVEDLRTSYGLIAVTFP